MPELYRGGVLLGRLKHHDFDQPWFIGTFEPAPAFEAVRALFEEEARLVEADEIEDRWDAIWDEINSPGLRLVWEDGTVDTEVLVHIDGTRADWRC